MTTTATDLDRAKNEKANANKAQGNLTAEAAGKAAEAKSTKVIVTIPQMTTDARIKGAGSQKNANHDLEGVIVVEVIILPSRIILIQVQTWKSTSKPKKTRKTTVNPVPKKNESWQTTDKEECERSRTTMKRWRLWLRSMETSNPLRGWTRRHSSTQSILLTVISKNSANSEWVSSCTSNSRSKWRLCFSACFFFRGRLSFPIIKVGISTKMILFSGCWRQLWRIRRCFVRSMLWIRIRQLIGFTKLSSWMITSSMCRITCSW